MVAAGFAGLACAIALAGCGPLPTVAVVQSAVAFEGGSCQIVVNAANVTANTTYGIGMYTTGSPAELGELTSNSSGMIINGRVSYPSNALPRQYSACDEDWCRILSHSTRSGRSPAVGGRLVAR